MTIQRPSRTGKPGPVGPMDGDYEYDWQDPENVDAWRGEFSAFLEAVRFGIFDDELREIALLCKQRYMHVHGAVPVSNVAGTKPYPFTIDEALATKAFEEALATGKIQGIAELRRMTGCGLAEAKKVVGRIEEKMQDAMDRNRAVATPHNSYAWGEPKAKPGLYKDPSTGEMWRVRRTRDKRRSYAEHIVVNTPAKLGRTGKVVLPAQIDYRKVTGAVYNIKPEWAITKEEAAQFGVSAGVCLDCGRVLQREPGASLGIGPVCIKKYNSGYYVHTDESE